MISPLSGILRLNPFLAMALKNVVFVETKDEPLLARSLLLISWRSSRLFRWLRYAMTSCQNNPV